MEDGAGDFGGEGFEFIESAAGGDASFFEERGVQDEGAAVHKRVIGRFERFAVAARRSIAGEQFFIELQIGLKIESVAGGPLVLLGERGEELAAKSDRIFAEHGLGFSAAGGKRLGVGDFESAGRECESGFALEKRKQVAIQSRVDLKGVTAVFDDVGIDETGDDALAVETIGEAQREFGGSVEWEWFCRRHVLRPW